jgi:hypothetical protein
MITRREATVGGALSLFFFAGGMGCGCATSLAPHSAGCLLSDTDFDSVYPRGNEPNRPPRGEEPIVAKSGNVDFDYALAQTLFGLSNRFDVLAGFAYYDDTGAENAFATPRIRMPSYETT